MFNEAVQVTVNWLNEKLPNKVPTNNFYKINQLVDLLRNLISLSVDPEEIDSAKIEIEYSGLHVFVDLYMPYLWELDMNGMNVYREIIGISDEMYHRDGGFDLDRMRFVIRDVFKI